VDGPVIPQIRQVTFDSTHARASAEFWRQLVGLVYRKGHEPPESGDDPAGRDWLNLLTPAGTASLAFQQVEVLARPTWPDSSIPQQLHLDLAVNNFEELMSASARVLDLGGAILLDRSNDPVEALRVFSDLDGHPFCIFVLAD
jgi:Glyoxalase-like domain